MQRYKAEELQVQGRAVYALTDAEIGAEARIVPAIGNQCSRYTWRRNGETLDLLVRQDDMEKLQADPTHVGNPILFPFPNRIRGGVFEFEGRTVQLPKDENGVNAIHGLVRNRPWRVVGFGADDIEGAWITSRIDSPDFEDLTAIWPFPFSLEYTYRFRDGALESEIKATNAGSTAMPMGFGVHPWFPMPLLPDGNRAECRLAAPVDTVWELEELLPTGRLAPAKPERNLAEGIAFADLDFDDVYAGLNVQGESESVYTDPQAGVEIAVRADSGFRELVIYAPLHRDVLCIEPYTCATDAFNLDARGIDAGTIRLEPGESWFGRIVYAPRPR